MKPFELRLYILSFFFFLGLGCSLYGQPQTKISGVVYDKVSQQAQPFVNIMVKGTTVGTVTDVDGKFNLTTQKKADTLIISSMGFKRQYLPLKRGESNYFEIYLEADNSI